MEPEYCVKEFELEFRIAKVRIQMKTGFERVRKWTEGREMQHRRWRDMGHTFVFPGLGHLIQMGKSGA